MIAEFIIIFFGLILLSLRFYFYSENRKLKRLHFQNELDLIRQISLCKEQIFRREGALHNYDFLKYNLSEALIIQSEIKIL